MEAEPPMLNAEERKEVYRQSRLRVMATADDMKVSAAFSSNTVPEGTDEISHHHQEGPVGTTISPKEGVQEIYLRKMFVMPANLEFYCPSCQVCVDKVFFCQIEITAAPLIDYPVQCSDCFTYPIIKGKEFFTGLVSRGPATGSPSNNRQPEDPEQTLKVASQREAPESAVNIADHPGKQILQDIEEVVLLGSGPHEVASEVEDETNGTGLGSILADIPGDKKSQDSSDSATSPGTFLDQKKSQVAPKKKHFRSDWAVKQPKPRSFKNSSWNVRAAENDFPHKKQPELVEAKVGKVRTGAPRDYFVQMGEWEQPSASPGIEALPPVEQLRCVSCFSFFIPIIGSWLFLRSVSDEDGAILINDPVAGSLSNNRHPEAPEPDQISEEVSQYVANAVVNIADDSETQILENIEKVASEVEDETNDTGPIGITISPTEGVQEIYLRQMFVMPATHEFYCPNCKVCIDKVRLSKMRNH